MTFYKPFKKLSMYNENYVTTVASSSNEEQQFCMVYTNHREKELAKHRAEIMKDIEMVEKKEGVKHDSKPWFIIGYLVAALAEEKFNNKNNK